MSELLLLKKEDCKSCYKCIRECALKSIRFSENRAQIVERECVYCGHCYVTCPQSAKEIRRDTDKVKALIAHVSKAAGFPSGRLKAGGSNARTRAAPQTAGV